MSAQDSEHFKWPRMYESRRLRLEGHEEHHSSEQEEEKQEHCRQDWPHIWEKPANDQGCGDMEAQEPPKLLVKYRNVRGIYSTIKQINNATKAGYRPDLYILSETWREHANQPIIKEYTAIAYVRARRKKKKGRASGGVTVYKHNECLTPVRQIQMTCGTKASDCSGDEDHDVCSASRNLTDALVLEIGGDDKQQGRATIVAYCCPPNQEASRIARYFSGLATWLK